jgi:hypothetical protein
MYNKESEGWKESKTSFGDCQIEYNTRTGEIVVYNDGFLSWDCETLRAFYHELEREGMYDG